MSLGFEQKHVMFATCVHMWFTYSTCVLSMGPVTLLWITCVLHMLCMVHICFKHFFSLTVDTLVILPFAIIIKFQELNLRGLVGEGIC